MEASNLAAQVRTKAPYEMNRALPWPALIKRQQATSQRSLTGRTIELCASSGGILERSPPKWLSGCSVLPADSGIEAWFAWALGPERGLSPMRPWYPATAVTAGQ